jgi:hypothetical protein
MGIRHTIPVNQEKKTLRDNASPDRAFLTDIIQNPRRLNPTDTQHMARIIRRLLNRTEQVGGN